MSDKKETKKNSEPSEGQAFEEEQSGDVPHIPSLDSTNQDSTNKDSTSQSSHQREEPIAGTSTAAETNQPESIVTSAAAISGIHPSEISVSGARTSKQKSFVNSISDFKTVYLSPRKNIGVNLSLQKSGQFVKDAVTAASNLKDAMAGAMTSATSGVKSVVSSIKGAVRSSQPNPESYSLVEPGSECEPPVKIPKKEKEFYCRIDTFVDRETKPKPSGNLTESTSFTSSDAASSLETDEQTSPTEETPLLRPHKSPAKEKSPSKEKSPKKE